MTPINFPEADGIIGKPPDMSDEDCASLSAAQGRWKAYPCIISAWKPTEEELDALNAGGVVYLHVLGTAQPPVILSTQIEAEIDQGGPMHGS